MFYRSDSTGLTLSGGPLAPPKKISALPNKDMILSKELKMASICRSTNNNKTERHTRRIP